MRFEPGPIPRLDVDAVLAAPDQVLLEPFVRDQVETLDAAHARIEDAVAVMQSDLDHPDLETFGALVDAAAGVHDAQTTTPVETLDAEIAKVDASGAELARFAAGLPPDDYVPDASTIGDLGGDFEGVDIDWDALRNRGGGGGSGGDDHGPRPAACALLALYADEHPDEAPTIARFLEENPGDCQRAPVALELADWGAFLARHGW